jgi:hypothetical protein
MVTRQLQAVDATTCQRVVKWYVVGQAETKRSLKGPGGGTVAGEWGRPKLGPTNKTVRKEGVRL